MTKLKKLSTAIVSILLASTMCVSFAACGGDDSGDSTSGTSTGTTDTGSTSTGGTSSSSGGSSTSGQTKLEVSTTSEGDLSYTDNITLNMNVGYNTSKDMQISYTTTNISGSLTLLDGKTYQAGSLKPAWQGLSDTLKITFNDQYANSSAADQIKSPAENNQLANYDIITGQSDTIVTYAQATANTFLDLSNYLDYMPNYKKFLTDNPIVYMSLVSDTDTGAMYYAPYFDGNDDIEKYELARLDWTKIILDQTTPSSGTITFASQASDKAGSNTSYGITGTEASVESYMGTEGSWNIESTDPDDASATVTITVNYDKALTAAQTSGTALNTAMTAVDGVDVSKLTSGNIVDLQNAAINATSGEVTGAQLTDILKAYIDVTYLDSTGSTYYETRSDVFNGADAAWDVDLFVAFSRCLITFGNKNLGTDTSNSSIYGVTGRENHCQRLNDMVSLAGELYGVRGLTSRYNYTYIDSNGQIQEARLDEDSYDALARMHTLAQEGIYNITATMGSGTNSYYTASTDCEAYMQYDYVQTQTIAGFAVDGVSSTTLPTGYDYEPINTPVSLWDDGNTDATPYGGTITYSYSGNSKYMRFTESWRSVKNTGFCVPYASVAGNPEKLAAVLKFIDYFFSNDGQILMTFGTQSSTNSAETSTAAVECTDDGWWYADEVTDVNIEDVATKVGDQWYINEDGTTEKKYFCYDGGVYEGTYYNGKMYPTMTNANLAYFYGYNVNGVNQKAVTNSAGETTQQGFASSGVLNYTNYARKIIGSALPIGNKLQAFEAQCTSSQGLTGANKVADGLVNGTISHVYQQVGSDNGKGYWYTIVPTTLPFTSTASTWISDNVSSNLDGKVFSGEKTQASNLYIDIIKYGYGAKDSVYLTYISDTAQMEDSAADIISMLNSTYSLNIYEVYMQQAWGYIDAFYWSNIAD